jgi:hypothetical protein
MLIQKISRRKWLLNNKVIVITDVLENWLNKPQYSPEFDKEKGIIKLNNFSFEEILEKVIENHPKTKYVDSDKILFELVMQNF